jgi:hypothetical protein
MDDNKRMDRREAIKWMLAASATISVLTTRSFGAAAAQSGYGTDPNLMEVYKAGDLWPLTFTPQQQRTVTALSDVILPAESCRPMTNPPVPANSKCPISSMNGSARPTPIRRLIGK